MDDWIPSDKVLSPPSVATKLGKGKEHSPGKLMAPTAPSGGKVRQIEQEGGPSKIQKTSSEDSTKADPTVIADMEHDEHEGMDEASLKEHEEVTKIKVRKPT